MTREDLFAAIGDVEESRLARGENMSSSNVTHLEGNEMTNATKRPKGRILRNTLVAALIVVMLATTVLAAPIVYRAVFGTVTDTYEMYTPTDAAGNSDRKDSHEIELEIELNEDAPEDIETYYVPNIPEKYVQSFGFAYSGMEFDGVDIAVYGWDIPDSEKMGIMFYQRTKESYDHGANVISVSTLPGEEPEMKQIELGGVEGLLILSPNETQWGRKYFCWSDGDYLFYLRVTYDFTEEQIGEMVASVRAVGDARPYLISMTEEEMRKTFEN